MKKNLTIKELCDLEYQNDNLIVPIGWVNDNRNIYMNFKKISGLFIAGATGTGKSVFIDDLIVSLMYKNNPQQIKFVMFDSKKIELGEYNGIKYLLSGKAHSNTLKGYNLLISILKLLEYRTNQLIKTKHRTIEGYNKTVIEKWPHVFLFIDEGCDIIKMKDAYNVFEKILDYGKYAGIHLVYATNSYLKDYANSHFLDKFKYRMTFDLSSIEQSNYIDIKGSSWLKQSGEALIKSPEGKIYKFQVPYITDKEIKDIVESNQIKK